MNIGAIIQTAARGMIRSLASVRLLGADAAPAAGE
jgi:hypothetical protein